MEINPVEIFSHPELWPTRILNESTQDLEKLNKILEKDARGYERWKKLDLIGAIIVTVTLETAAWYFRNSDLAYIGLAWGGALGFFSWGSRENAIKSHWMSQEIIKVLECRQEFLDKN